MSFILILISVMLLLDGVWWYLADRMARRSSRRRLWRSVVAIFATVQIVGLGALLISRIAGQRADEAMGTLVMTSMFIWHFIGLAIFLIALLLNGSWVSVGRLSKPAAKREAIALSQPTTPSPTSTWEREQDAISRPETSPTITRRGFLGVAVTVPPLISLGATGYSLGQQNDFRIRSFEFPIARLPKALDGLTIAHVSDTHVGGFTRGAVLQKIVDETNKLNADLVLFTGDLINHALSDLPQAVDMLQKIRFREAMYVCEGNHDLIENRFLFEAYARDRKLPILINQTATISIREQALQLLGLRWGGLGARSPRARDHADELIEQSMQTMLPQLNPDAFQILLAHHPHAFDVAEKNKIPLTLSGHTHGGQIMLTDNFGFGPAMYRYWSGLYEKQDSKLLVSNGVGNWFPLRIGAPAEILHITLRAG